MAATHEEEKPGTMENFERIESIEAIETIETIEEQDQVSSCFLC